MEYKAFAKYYDLFYQKKDYKKEVNFLENFINEKDVILDVGCGTGVHASILGEKHEIDGLDLNKEMLKIAKKRINGTLYNQDILDININKKYDVIISMFAVINHLNNTDELVKAFQNLKDLLKPNGVIIIDLHNPQASGSKIDKYDGLERTMTWNYDNIKRIEYSDITFKINDVIYHDQHVFKIFTINEMKECAKKVGLSVIGVYANYDITKKGTKESKNLQFIIK